MSPVYCKCKFTVIDFITLTIKGNFKYTQRDVFSPYSYIYIFLFTFLLFRTKCIAFVNVEAADCDREIWKIVFLDQSIVFYGVFNSV